MSYNESIIPSYFLFITSIFFTLSLSNKFSSTFVKENSSLTTNKFFNKPIVSIDKSTEQNINILLDKINEDKKLFIETNCNSNKSFISKELLIKKNEEKNEFIIHNMDLFFNELYIAFFIFDSFADENKKLFDDIKPIIYYNNYLDIYDVKHCLVLDNYLNNKFGWIIISDECQTLKNEEIFSQEQHSKEFKLKFPSAYINFSYENMNEFIIWKKNFEESKKKYSNIIKINFYSEKYSMYLDNDLPIDKYNFKSYYIMYKNNMIENNI